MSGSGDKPSPPRLPNTDRHEHTNHMGIAYAATRAPLCVYDTVSVRTLLSDCLSRGRQRDCEDLWVLAEVALKGFEEENEVAVQLSDLWHSSVTRGSQLSACWR